MSEPTPSETSTPSYSQPVAHESAWAKFSRWLGERVAGLAEFVGILIGIGVSARRLIFALGCGMLACGMGKSLVGWWRGPQWMFWGAVLIALTLPIKFNERK